MSSVTRYPVLHLSFEKLLNWQKSSPCKLTVKSWAILNFSAFSLLHYYRQLDRQLAFKFSAYSLLNCNFAKREWFVLTHYYCRQPWLLGILQMFQLLASLISPLLQFLHLQCKLMLLHLLCQPYRYPRFQHLLLQYPIMMFLNPSAVIEPQNLWSLLFSPLPLLQQWWYPQRLHPHLLPLHFILLLMYNVHTVLHCYSHFHHQIHHHHLLLLPLQTTVLLFLEKRFEMLFWCLFRLVYLLGACVINILC